jgi:hypothetical protein
MGLPSKKKIQEWFGAYFQHEGVDPKVGAAMVRKALEEAKNPDAALDAVNALIRGHGIEAIRGDYQVDRYYYDIVALYVNMGDSYAGTLLYETDTRQFHVTTMGDWVEWKEKKYRIF